MIIIELRAYQKELINNIKAAYKGGKKSVCAVLSCGGGKSVIAAHVAKSATDKNNRVLFIVHRRELCEQITNTFETCGVNMKLCTVGMVQTISRRLNKIKTPGIIITDEAHHCLSTSYKRIYEHFNKALLLGFTATPVRLNDGGLGKVFEELIESVSAKWLIENKFLAPYKYYSVPVADMSKLKVSRGEYDSKQLADIMESKRIYGETIKTYQRIAEGKKTIVYCVSVESSKQTALKFQEAGYAAENLDGKTSNQLRKSTMQDFRDGKIQILCNCELFGEGLDIPDVECVIMLRKTKSLTLYIQQAMRAMRYRPGKTAIIIDHVGNIFEHDFPDADRVWSLESRKHKTPGVAPVKQCEICYSVLPAGTKICPECYYMFPIQAQMTKEAIEVELQDITDIYIHKPYNYYKRLKTWDEIELFRKTRNYKFLWSIHKALELGIEIPEKYRYQESRVKQYERANSYESNYAGAIKAW